MNRLHPKCATRPPLQGLMHLAVLVTLLGLPGAAAWAGHEDDHEQDRRGHDNRDHDQRDHDKREHRMQSQRRPEYRPRYEHPYAQPIYVPAPVYEEPRQSPGISLFLPFDLRR